MLFGFGLESKVQALYNSDEDVKKLKLSLHNEDTEVSLREVKSFASSDSDSKLVIFI